MGLFGNNRRTMSAAQQVAAGGDGVDPNTVPHGDPRNRVFGDGSIGGIVGGIGKVLSYGPFIGLAQEGINRRRQLDDTNMAYKNASIQHMGQTEDPSVIRTLRSAGIDPQSPQGRQIIMQNLTTPRIMAVPGEGGTTEYRDFNQVDGSAPAVPPPPTVGQVVNGHVFLGGDPASDASWRKQ
jgi:hypothetical protein